MIDRTHPFLIHVGDCLETLKALPDNSIDSIVTDPPYGLSKEPDMAEVLRHWLAGDDYQHKGGGFMGKTWDSFVPGPSVWKECLRVLKPGGHLLAFFGTRTQDMGTLAIRLAGFEIRDGIAWVYGSGFPKSLDVSKAIDKAAGAERQVLSEGKAVKRMIPGADQNATGSWIKDNGREYVPTVTAAATAEAAQWQGWGTALKPALEPITVARKPLAGNVAANVLAHGAGALNIDGCRVGGGAGRWPANLIHDGSDEVVALFPANAGAAAPVKGSEASKASVGKVTGERERVPGAFHADSGSAARFFYCPKASRKDRNEGLIDPGPQFKRGTTLRHVENTETTGNTHPTVKPTDLMAYLCRLVTPPGGTVLDPFMGSGSTGKAAIREGFRFIGCELLQEYADIARARLEHASRPPAAPAEKEKQPDLFESAI